MYLGRNRTMTMCVLGGAIIGFVIGVLQIIIMGSWEFVRWVGMPMMPLYSAAGWALYGMILGGSGIFSKRDQTDAREEVKETRVKGVAA
jgi:hypothetical protein